ncbi:unspecified product [Leptomonas pyrrhocoris]|uniref:Unspecified product n=1 Tax=Leptomonas pyrrhocoris TaxID=157538 RepID=A0A0M9FNX2_LEPPY|nr:unspecified product [Leptomonas pyrrhocoris]KPA73090.1 unspecified product [Leptomonas pyrrhocoris]|eukprot:XP_015651529.1 unspecified product [Leptomonas pyrrhocoris]
MTFTQFIIVGPNDACLFSYSAGSSNNSEIALTHQFSLYSALDVVDESMWARSDFYMSKVDRPYGDAYCISAYVGLAPARLLLMQDCEPKESIATFFAEAYQLCVRYFMNSFCSTTKKITSTAFRDEISILCRKYC